MKVFRNKNLELIFRKVPWFDLLPHITFYNIRKNFFSLEIGWLFWYLSLNSVPFNPDNDEFLDTSMSEEIIDKVNSTDLMYKN